MVKSLHFCTPKLLEFIKNPENKRFHTFRTGWSPELYPNDIIDCSERDDCKNDTFLCKGIIEDVSPLRLLQIDDMYKFEGMFPDEEISRYNRKFNKWHWFFQITILKV